MPDEIVSIVIDKLAKRFMRVSLLVLVLVGIIPAVSAICIYKNFMGFETHLQHLDYAATECWRISHQKDFADGLKINNPNLTIPDPVKIVQEQRAMNEHGGEQIRNNER